MYSDCRMIHCRGFQTFTFCVELEFNANSKLIRHLNNLELEPPIANPKSNTMPNLGI